MIDEKLFVQRIKSLREITAKIRDDEKRALRHAMEDMDNALGHMISFTSMNCLEFPVSVEEVSVSEDAEQICDFGAHVVAWRGEGQASRVYADVVSDNALEHIAINLHYGKPGSPYRWVLEATVRSFDGHESNSETYFEDAESALKSLKVRVLSSALRTITRGKLALKHQIPDTDADAAIEIKKIIDNGCALSKNMQLQMEKQREDRYRVSMALRGIWTKVAPKLEFLSELGFFFEGSGDRSINTSNTNSGIRINIHHGEGYRSTILAESEDIDTQMISFSVSDNEGRALKTTQVSLTDEKTLSDLLATQILEEIEGAEVTWLSSIKIEEEKLNPPSFSM